MQRSAHVARDKNARPEDGDRFTIACKDVPKKLRGIPPVQVLREAATNARLYIHGGSINLQAALDRTTNGVTDTIYLILLTRVAEEEANVVSGHPQVRCCNALNNAASPPGEGVHNALMRPQSDGTAIAITK
mmetsp:Transcript_106418/g.211410  ORF Transcript_106418/g.211410 Transcript_106418/m.211410 type:complete len:132 (+) Transcript_106418:1085-1480(+)